MNKPEWLFDETTSVGVDYFDQNRVNHYDEEHKKFRNFEEEAAKIAELLYLTEKSTLLDIGCGTGGLSTCFSHVCRHVYAVDASPAMLYVLKRKIEKHGITNITTIQSGLLSYEHTGEQLDAVIMSICLHHLPDFWKQIALNKLNTFLKPGGKLFISDVVFDFNAEEYNDVIDSWITHMHTTAGKEMADEIVVHVRDEYSTWDWIMTGLLERAHFHVDMNSEIMDNTRIYVCTKL